MSLNDVKDANIISDNETINSVNVKDELNGLDLSDTFLDESLLYNLTYNTKNHFVNDGYSFNDYPYEIKV